MGGFQQRQWTPTKRRGPIAAEFSGPGPAAVALPTLVGEFCLKIIKLSNLKGIKNMYTQSNMIL